MTTSKPKARLIGGRYRIDRQIGAGGMGTVWAGRDELLGRQVAVKEVRFPVEIGEREQSDLRERTLREARVTARLSHPNVVTTYDVVEEDGRPWIVMELLPSRSLSAMLREDGPLPPDQVADLGLAMLGALEVAHQQGMVHRDVKPGNVLITPDGRPVLTDFGIATMAGDPSLTSTGVLLGSPAYMSPERAMGQRPGPEADMWSLGATLYAAVEGRPPFDSGNALSTLTAVISDPVEPPTTFGPLRDAILGLLEKDPAQRLGILTTRELLNRAAADQTAGVPPDAAGAGALDRANRTEALSPAAPAPPTSSATTYGGPAPGRRPGRIALAAGLVVALLLVLGGIRLMASPEDKAPASAQPSGDTTAASSRAPSTSPTASAPLGLRTHADPSGFTVAVPPGWRTARSGSQVKFLEPGTTRYLLVDQTDSPRSDPKADWERQEKSFASSHDNYQRISIESVQYRDFPTADWRFTYATRTQVINRGFVAGGKGYALYLSGPRNSWPESEQIFNQAAESFAPAGG
jgi:eukaryotic-like serine/threonine-protein kinase